MRANQVLLSKSLEVLVTMNDRSGSTYENVTSDLNGFQLFTLIHNNLLVLE